MAKDEKGVLIVSIILLGSAFILMLIVALLEYFSTPSCGGLG